jgi:hypothetical protein
VQTIGVFKGQTSFSDNQWFQVQYTGPGTYTSRTIKVVLYDRKKILQSKKMRWEKTWQGRKTGKKAGGKQGQIR